MSGIGDTVLNGAAGLAAATGVGASIAVVLKAIQLLGGGGWITKHVFGEDGAETATKYLDVIQGALGGQQPTADNITTLPPDKRAEVMVQLEQIAAQREKQRDDAKAAAATQQLASMQAMLADIKDARSRDVALQAGGKRNWRADLMLLFTILGIIAIIALLSLGHVDGNTAVGGAILTVLGALVNCYKDGFSFEFGSTRGSENKTDILANSVPINMVNALTQGGASNTRPLAQ